MSTIVLLIGVPLLAGAGWSRAILDDESLYVRSITPLASSRFFADLASISVATSARLKMRSRPRISRGTARVAGRGIRWAMGTAAFGPTWIISHRTLHRNQHLARRQGRSVQLKTTTLMISLAAMGSIIGLTSSKN
ncbi:MAG: hypothetical protein KDB26_01255 [Microthrixaceae bacterium]|nr:hypothetical protein [Microthrixaceae bacterium]